MEIHNALEGDGKYFFVSIGRQFGKTIMAENQAVKWCLDNPDWKVVWVSPTYKQCKKVFKDIRRAIDKANLYGKKPNESDLVIYFSNGSELLFYSAEAYDSIRGETFDAGVGDEMAFWKREAWTEVLKATLLVRGKKFLGLSTPKGKNLFYELANQSHDNKDYHTFKGTSYDNPFIDIKEIEDAKRTLPEHIFRQEYLAEFVDGGAGVFKDLNIDKAQQITKNCFAGLDVGRADDYTVLSIFNEKGEQFYIERWRHSDWATIVKNIANGLRTNNVQTALVEVNSIGDVIFEMLQKECSSYCTIEPFVTTNQSKKEIVESLIVANQNKEVKFLNVDWLDKELEMFTYEYNPKSRVIKYSATSGFHDDGVMASCLSFHAYSKYKTGRYTII